MDLGEIGPGIPDTLGLLHEQLFTLGARLVKPLIAAVHGAALGGGTGLVANCHIVLADPDATFGLTEIRLGLWPFLVFYAVAAAIGERRTLELALTGRIFHAAEARELGLIHEISSDLDGRASELATPGRGLQPDFAADRGCGSSRAPGDGIGSRRANSPAGSGATSSRLCDFQEGLYGLQGKTAAEVAVSGIGIQYVVDLFRRYTG